jgi:hypothetical protein
MPTKTIIATTSAHTSNDTAPSVRSARWSGHGWRRRSSTCCSAQLIGSHCVEMIFLAAADFSIQPMNAEAAPFALPLVTS